MRAISRVYVELGLALIFVISPCLSTEVTSIHEAAKVGDKDKVRAFLDQGVDINAKDDREYTPLSHAIREGHGEITTFLIDRDADIDAKDKWGYAPLYYAIWNEDVNTVKLLVDKGANVNVKPKGDGTPLIYAVWNEDLEMARLFIANGARLDGKDENGLTAFHNAVLQANREFVDFFVDQGVDVSGIHGAVCLGDLPRIKSQLEQGTDIDIKDEVGWTPLFWAASMRQNEIGEYLLAKGAKADTKSKNERTPLHQAANSGSLRLAELLISKGGDVNAKDKRGSTPIFDAASAGHQAVVELLIAKGVTVNAKDGNDRTPLHRAAMAGQRDVVEILVANGADIDAKDKSDRTALHMAAMRGRNDVAELLIAKGADVNSRNANGQTPLHLSSGQGRKDIAELLILNGADANAKNKWNRTPLNIATGQGHTETVELLRKHIQVHDVVVTEVSVSDSCIQGETVPIVVTLENRSDSTESCAVKLIDATNDREIARQPAHIHPKHRTASEADLTLTGEKGTTGSFGNWCWADGDVNGDGFNDLLITAQEYPDKVAPTDGRAYLYYGGTNMSTASAAKTFDPENTGDRLGDNSGMFADINNDNFDDVIIGSRYYGSGDEGRVYVYYGGTDMNLTPDIYLDLPSGEGTNASLGRGGLSAGDLNNDGYIDVVASAVRYPNGTKLGRVYLWYGPLASNTVVDKTFSSESDSYCFGAILSARGDVNGDNCDDLLIAHRYYPNNTGVGRAYLYWGAKGTAMDTTADVIFDCPDSGANNFGSSADLFDIDNDGCAEVIIGARNWPGDGTGEGRVYLYWGKTSGFDNTVGLTFENQDGPAPHFGGDFVHGGYADDDQYGDLIVVAFDYNNRQSRAYLYYGSTQGGMDNVCDHTFTGDGTGFDAYRAALSDLNNDGYGDVVLAGANYPSLEGQGRCLLWYGPFDTTTDITFNWNTINASPGKHTLKVEIPPIPGEKDISNNTMTVTIKVKEPSK